MCRSIFALFFIAAIGCAVPAANASETTQASGTPSPQQAALLRALADEAMLPLTARFEEAGRRMAATAASFCAGKTDLRAMQASWRNAASAWQPLEMLQIGPAITRRTQRQINFWPVRPNLLERLQSGLPLSVEQMDAAPPSGKGFPAIEYLLYEASGRGDKKLEPARCELLKVLSEHVARETKGLADDWRGPEGGFARQLKQAGTVSSSAYPTADQALSDTLNLLIAGLDAMKGRKIGKPLEKSKDQLPQENLEAWRSATSLARIVDNLLGFERFFFGTGQSGIGFDDYLTAIERPGLARVMRERMADAKRALSDIKPPLERAIFQQRPQVEALQKALTEIQVLLETEVADALKVDLGFNTADGD